LFFWGFFSTKGLDLSFQEQKQKSRSSGSVFIIFLCSKTSFLTQKFYALFCALLKIENVFACSSRTGRDILKIPTDLDSAGQNHFISIKNPKK
jgi:hypothetical protein